MFLLSRLPRSWKVWLRAQCAEAERWYARAFRSYGPDELAAALHALGVASGDTVMLHSAFGSRYGFRGTIDDLTRVFLDAVGPAGNLLMVSLPYRSSSLEYLSHLKSFDVRKTPSMMGLVSEYFRRRAGVVRSLHPTHPVLAVGPDAEAIVAGHEDCRYPCGPGTPFEKLADLDGKVIFFNVPFATFTFFHYLEHLVSPQMPFPLYTEQPFEVPVVDRFGERRTVSTYVFSLDAIRRRRFEVLERELRRRGLIRRARVGNSRIEMIRVRDAIDCTRDMLAKGQYFYDVAKVRT
jgi:aminoglycoside 3-N-acetyltransferase